MDLAFDLAGPGFVLTPQGILGSLYHSEWKATAGISLGVGVALWQNATSNGNLVQAVGAMQPAYEAATFNGGPCVHSDGVDDELRAAMIGLNVGQRPYCWVVTQRVAAVGVADYQVSLVDTVPNGPAYNAMHTAGTWNQDRGSSDGTALVTSPVVVNGNRHLIEWGLTAAGDRSIVVDVTSSANSPVVGGLGAALGFLQLFVVAVGALPSNARIAHLVIASNEPTQAQRDLMRAYFQGANFPAYTGSSYALS